MRTMRLRGWHIFTAVLVIIASKELPHVIEPWVIAQSSRPPAPDSAMEAAIRRSQADLRSKYAEYEQGRRDYRDAYFLINQILWMYPQHEGQPLGEGRLWQRRADELLAKHPDLRTSEPTMLSEQLAIQSRAREEEERLSKLAVGWAPPDIVPVHYFVSGSTVLAVYQYRIEAYEDPKAAEYKAYLDGRSPKVSEISPNPALPSKVLQFKGRFDLETASRQPQRAVLLCTTLLRSAYFGMTDEESGIMCIKGIHEGYNQCGHMTWANPRGEIDQFCGILSLKGETVFEFPIRQQVPDLLVRPIGISTTEDRAVIAIGEQLLDNIKDDGPYTYVGKIRELWTWEAPDRLIKTSTSTLGTGDIEEIRRRFFSGKL